MYCTEGVLHHFHGRALWCFTTKGMRIFRIYDHRRGLLDGDCWCVFFPPQLPSVSIPEQTLPHGSSRIPGVLSLPSHSNSSDCYWQPQEMKSPVCGCVTCFCVGPQIMADCCMCCAAAIAVSASWGCICAVVWGKFC